MLTSEQIISVVAPVHNLQDTIVEFLDITTSVLKSTCRNYELILIDDGSTDETVNRIRARIASEPNVRLVVLSRQHGQQIALTAGLEHSIGDYVVLMGAAFQHPPELIPKLIARAKEGFDVVYVAKRPGAKEPLLRRLVSSVFFRLASRATSFHLRQDVINYLVLSRRAVNSITRLKENNRYMPMIYEYIGYAVATIPFEDSSNRLAVPQGYSYRQKTRLAIDAIVSFSDRPLRYLASLSLLISFVALIGAVWVAVDKFRSDEIIEGWTSLMLLQLLMFSMLFMFLAVFSEYISRIMTETKRRPLYYVREEHGGTNFAIGGIVNTD